MSDELKLILSAPDGHHLQAFACRGSGKGCKRNTFRVDKKPCDDCYGPVDQRLTVGEVKALMERGDA